MKKLAALSAGVGYLALGFSVFAQVINIQRPTVAGRPVGFGDIGEFINNGITLAFILAIIVVLVMFVWGAVQWIFSGGDKEALVAARGRIINALIGLVILAVAFAIFVIAGQFLGFQVGPGGIDLPIPRPGVTTPGACLPPQIFNPATGQCA